MFAIISDIHSNTEALAAVLSDIKQQGITAIHCLGDVIGYGPQPAACLDMIMAHCDRVILGNHDWAVLYEPNRFNLGAENAVFWTRHQLEIQSDKTKVARRWEFLGQRKVREVIPAEPYGLREIVLVHGSPRRPINEYLFPDDAHNNAGKIESAMDRIEHVCFVGHTHLPGVFTEDLNFFSPDDCGGTFEFGDDKAIVNVGSVGQPRDRDPRASYVIVRDNIVTFRRVEYNVSAVVEAVEKIPELDDYLGTRLVDGR